LNGINWLAISDHDHYWDFPLYIVSLDLGNETYTQLSLPSCFDQVHRVTRTKPNLGILKDRLCFSYDDVAKTHFVLWQMNEYGVENSWTQLLKLSYQALQIDCTTQEYCISPSQNSFFLIRNPPRNCRGFISRIRSQWKDSLTKVQKC
jgi:hypothetical protein